MMSQENSNPQKTARIAGFLYLLLVPLGIFGILYVPNALVDSGNITATVNNIMANQLLFRSSIVSALVAQVVQIFVVLFLYRVLRPVNKNYAALMVIFILVAVPIAMLNELNQIVVLILLNQADNISIFSADQINGLVSMFLDLHRYGIVIAQIFWGLWLFPMGYLVLKSGFIPKIIGILLIVACFGYLVDSFIYFFNPTFGITFSEFTFLGELFITFWLVIKGVDAEQWRKKALALEIA